MLLALLLLGASVSGQEPTPKVSPPVVPPPATGLPNPSPAPPALVAENAPLSPIPDQPIPSGAPPPPKPLNPLRAGEKPPEQPIVRLEGARLKMGEIEFDSKERTISFPAKVNMNQGNLEYLLVADHGKVHEALLSTRVQPFYLNVVFLLLKYQRAENFLPPLPGENKKKTNQVLNETNCFDCKLTWTNQKGEAQAALLTDWLYNGLTKKPVDRSRWVYSGATVDDNGSFMPQLEGSIIAIYTDYVAMINSPLDGNDNDEIWLPAPNLPPVGTKVQITFLPYREAEVKNPPKKK